MLISNQTGTYKIHLHSNVIILLGKFRLALGHWLDLQKWKKSMDSIGHGCIWTSDWGLGRYLTKRCSSNVTWSSFCQSFLYSTVLEISDDKFLSMQTEKLTNFVQRNSQPIPSCKQNQFCTQEEIGTGQSFWPLVIMVIFTDFFRLGAC